MVEDLGFGNLVRTQNYGLQEVAEAAYLATSTKTLQPDHGWIFQHCKEPKYMSKSTAYLLCSRIAVS